MKKELEAAGLTRLPAKDRYIMGFPTEKVACTGKRYTAVDRTARFRTSYCHQEAPLRARTQQADAAVSSVADPFCYRSERPTKRRPQTGNTNS